MDVGGTPTLTPNTMDADESTPITLPPRPRSINGITQRDASGSMIEGGIPPPRRINTGDDEHYIDQVDVDTDEDEEGREDGEGDEEGDEEGQPSWSSSISNITRQRYTRVERDDLEVEPVVHQPVNFDAPELTALNALQDGAAPTVGNLASDTTSINGDNADDAIMEGNTTPRAADTPLPRITFSANPPPSDPPLTPITPVDTLSQTREQLESNSAQSTALLSSLRDLRTNLQTRVDSLGQEVDRLRRRAEELERGLRQDNARQDNARTTTASSDQEEQDVRARAFRDANNRVRALRLLRQERLDRVQAEATATAPLDGQEAADPSNLPRVALGERSANGVGEGTGGRRELDGSGQATTLPIGTTIEDIEMEEEDPTEGKKRGSGSLDIEGDRVWRRNKRMASYLSLSSTLGETATAINAQSIAAAGRTSSNLLPAPTPAPANAIDSRSPFRFSPDQRSRSRSTPDGVPPRIYTPEEVERLRHPARSFGTVYTEGEAESLTSRGRRVASSINAVGQSQRIGTPSQQPRPEAQAQPQPRALPTDARTMTDTEARNNIRTALTRYRDALMSAPPERTTERDLVTYRLLQRAYTQVATGTAIPATDTDTSNREREQEQQQSQETSNVVRITLNTLDEQRGDPNAVRITVDASANPIVSDDIPIATEFADDGATTSNGANLSRRITLRLPPARTTNPPATNASAAPVTDQNGPISGPGPSTQATQTLNQLAVLSQTIQSLTDRLETARRLVRLPTDAGRSARAGGPVPTSSRTRRNAEAGISASPAAAPAAAMTATTATGPPPPRRPTHPASHNVNHPHHRPRIGPDPIAAVINCDNYNSFDINFDGNVVFRPVAARLPDRELIARCLSMLPGGRDNVPSRWMRLTGDGTSRARRPTTTAGFWVRWVSGPDVQPYGLRLREMQWNNLPPIVAFQFSACPPEDDAWLRADEVEFYTPRTRLRQHLGPWMHSRVRRAPFETDPPIARWGTSAHVRQTVDACGGLANGDFVTLNLLDRTVEVHRASAATTRQPTTELASNNNPIPAAPAPPTPIGAISGSSGSIFAQLEAGEDDRDASRWLNVYEPAISQIRMDWRAHYRRSGLGPLPLTGGEQPEDSAASGSEDRGGRGEHRGERVSGMATPRAHLSAPGQQGRWSRDFLDADGNLLPPVAANRASDMQPDDDFDPVISPPIVLTVTSEDAVARYL